MACTLFQDSKEHGFFLRNSLLTLLLTLLFLPFANGQDTTSIGGLMDAAKDAAFNKKDYENAVRLGKKALLLIPANTEILVFIGRTYSWMGSCVDSSALYLQRANGVDSTMEDAYIALADLYYWNKMNTQAFTVIERGMNILPGSQQLHIRKAKVLAEMGDIRTALQVTDTLLETDKHNAEIRALNINLKDLKYKDRVSVKFDYAHFDKQFPDDWQFYSAEYTHATKRGALLMRVNMADRFKQNGLQYEVDAYPRLSKTFYMYLNAGFSDQGQIFPRWRSGLSLYANLPHAFEAEAGVRHLQYNQDVFFYVGYIGKYYKNFLFGSRVYVTPSTAGFSGSVGVIGRYYFGGSDDYINLNLFAGVSPDDRRLNLQVNSNSKVQSHLGELSFRKSIRKINVIGLNISLFRQEFYPGITGNQLQAGLAYTRRF